MKKYCKRGHLRTTENLTPNGTCRECRKTRYTVQTGGDGKTPYTLKAGDKFGRWTVLERGDDDKHGNPRWWCQCECPLRTKRLAYGRALVNKASQSCGCLQKENVVIFTCEREGCGRTKTVSRYQYENAESHYCSWECTYPSRWNDWVFAVKKRGGIPDEPEIHTPPGEPRRCLCQYGHTFQISLNKLLEGQWCPHCHELIKEPVCRAIMEALLMGKFPPARPDWLEGLELDGYDEGQGIALEYDGEQHRKRNPFYHSTEERFASQQERDQRKDQGCLAQGIRLIRVDTPNIYEMEKCIRGRAKKMGIPVPRETPVNVDELQVDFGPITRENLRRLGLMNIELRSQYQGMRVKHPLRCTVCGYEWDASLEYYMDHPCPKCSERARAQEFQRSLDERLDTEQVVGRYESGESIESIARERGVGTAVIRSLLREAGIRIRRRDSVALEKKLTDNKDNIIESFMGGERIHSISRRLKCNNNTITKVLQDWGVPTRSPIGTMWSAETKRIVGGKGHIIQLYKDGGTSRKIGADYEVGSNVILKWLRLWAVEIRKQSPQVGYKHSEGAKRKMSVGHSKPWSAARREAENRGG